MQLDTVGQCPRASLKLPLMFFCVLNALPAFESLSPLNTGGESCRRGFENAQNSQRNKKCTEISKKWVIRETRPKREH